MRAVTTLAGEGYENCVVVCEDETGWQVFYNRQDTSKLCFAEKILHREIMRRIEESTA